MTGKIYEAITEHWGERCKDFDPECVVCQAWAEFDEIERLRAALRDISDYDGPIAIIFDADDAIAMKGIARAALGEKE